MVARRESGVRTMSPLRSCGPEPARLPSDVTGVIHDECSRPIEINPNVMLGKPVIRGTRIPVDLIVRKVAEGADERALLEAYPRLTLADIQAALQYAADSASKI